MKTRIAVLLLAFAFVSVPVFAQGAPGVSNGVPFQALAKDIAALADRVSKLEGNVGPAELAGTYNVVGLSSGMSAFKPGTPPVLATIEMDAFRAQLILNADG